MPPKLKLVGKKFARWTVLEEYGKYNGQFVWLCECKCGKIKTVVGGNLRNGRSQSCGCLQRELQSEQSRTHGMYKHPVYFVWDNMKRRCNNSNNPQYKNYGARGIKVCERWLKFENFRDDMFPTYHRGLSIERIDNDGDYVLENCRWASNAEQIQNSRKARLNPVQVKEIRRASENKDASIKQLAKKYDVDLGTIYAVCKRKSWANVA